MQDIWQLIRTRRSIRRFDSRPVPAAMVRQMLEAAVWAPSAHNRQPWRFVIIENEATRQRLVMTMNDRLRHDLAADGVSPELIERDAGRSAARLLGAPLIILLA